MRPREWVDHTLLLGQRAKLSEKALLYGTQRKTNTPAKVLSCTTNHSQRAKTRQSQCLCILSYEETRNEQIHTSHRPLIVAVESLLTAEGPAADVPVALVCSEGILLGCSGIFAISFFASSQASRFCQPLSASDPLVQKGRTVHTFLHHSRWLRAMLIDISRRSATFWRWKRSRSAWIVELVYLRSWAER